MHVNRVAVTGLHGFINTSVDLTDDLAIIVGVNGAGKTSILNLTAHLLRLNLPELLAIKFEKLTIRGRNDRKIVELTCERGQGILQIKLKLGGRVFDNQCVKVTEMDRLDPESRNYRFAYDRMIRRLYEEVTGSKLYSFLKKSAHLTLVRLDRTIFAEENDGLVAIELPRSVRSAKDQVIEDPIGRVQSVTSDRYNVYRVVSKKLNEDLTREIVLLLFKTPRLFSRGRANRQISAQQLERLREKLLSLPYFLEDQLAAKQIKEYFDVAISATDMPSVISSAEQSATEMLFRSFEFPRIKGLVDAFARHEKEVAKAYTELDSFLVQINSFLTESGKEVFFSEAEASLRFRLKGGADKAGRPIDELSSGEKQIVTMLTYLAFVAGEKSIFVVDEPELSLHLAWQMKLVDALISLQPAGSQLILATHSPEIVGRHRGSVVGLSPSYSE